MRHLNRSIWHILLIILICLSGSNLHAQSYVDSQIGPIRDSLGNVLQNLSVDLKDVNGTIVRYVSTNEQGIANFGQLETGISFTATLLTDASYLCSNCGRSKEATVSVTPLNSGPHFDVQAQTFTQPVDNLVDNENFLVITVLEEDFANITGLALNDPIDEMGVSVSPSNGEWYAYAQTNAQGQVTFNLRDIDDGNLYISAYDPNGLFSDTSRADFEPASGENQVTLRSLKRTSSLQVSLRDAQQQPLAPTGEQYAGVTCYAVDYQSLYSWANFQTNSASATVLLAAPPFTSIRYSCSIYFDGWTFPLFEVEIADGQQVQVNSSGIEKNAIFEISIIDEDGAVVSGLNLDAFAYTEYNPDDENQLNDYSYAEINSQSGQGQMQVVPDSRYLLVINNRDAYQNASVLFSSSGTPVVISSEPIAVESGAANETVQVQVSALRADSSISVISNFGQGAYVEATSLPDSSGKSKIRSFTFTDSSGSATLPLPGDTTYTLYLYPPYNPQSKLLPPSPKQVDLAADENQVADLSGIDATLELIISPELNLDAQLRDNFVNNYTYCFADNGQGQFAFSDNISNSGQGSDLGSALIRISDQGDWYVGCQAVIDNSFYYSYTFYSPVAGVTEDSITVDLSNTGEVYYPTESYTLDNQVDNDLIFANGKLRVVIPAESIMAGAADLILSAGSKTGFKQELDNNYFAIDMSIKNLATGAVISEFQKPIKLIFLLDEDDVPAGVDPAKIAGAVLTDSNSFSVAGISSTYDPDTRELTISTDHFSVYAAKYPRSEQSRTEAPAKMLVKKLKAGSRKSSSKVPYSLSLKGLAEGATSEFSICRLGRKKSNTTCLGKIQTISTSKGSIKRKLKAGDSYRIQGRAVLNGIPSQWLSRTLKVKN